jgi:hypothetical protein
MMQSKIDEITRLSIEVGRMFVSLYNDANINREASLHCLEAYKELRRSLGRDHKGNHIGGSEVHKEVFGAR